MLGIQVLPGILKALLFITRFSLHFFPEVLRVIRDIIYHALPSGFLRRSLLLRLQYTKNVPAGCIYYVFIGGYLVVV